MLGGKIIERQQYVAIFLEAGNGFIVFDSIKLDESIERRIGILARLGHPDVLQGYLGLRLNALRQLVEHVRSLVHPTALLAHLAPDLADGFPEAERAVRDDELGRQGETAAFQIEQQFLPG
jgi:hypothetical protein